MSIGWGIRGNFGHETGAMIPGALAAMAAVLLCGREDWLSRIPFFGFFGALGWSFGGSISYMQVIAYTHSGHSLSVLYGFASLFVIGFLWAAFGGAGTALPAILSERELNGFFPPIIAVFIGWCVQDALVYSLIHADPAFRQNDPLYWYDTDWVAALVAIISVFILAACRRKWDQGSSLILHMALGWWLGFLLLVVVLGLRMTPPRGDNWAGCVGMAGGMWIHFAKRGQRVLVYSSMLAGMVGGIGFAGADLLKLVEIKSGFDTNWHSVLEQTYGLINGIGIGLLALVLARRMPKAEAQPMGRRWQGGFAIVFLLVVVTWLNLRKNVETWVKAQTVPATLYGWPAEAWFNAAYAALLLLCVGLLITDARRPLAMFNVSPRAKGQLLFLIFLWWVVVGNFERAIVSFAPQRLVTEGVIFLNAVLCTFLVVSGPAEATVAVPQTTEDRFSLRGLVAIGITLFVVSTASEWGLVRILYGDKPAGYANLHIRFGPNATATQAPPPPGKPHP